MSELRPWARSDAESLRDALQKSPDLAAQLGRETLTLAQAEDHIDRFFLATAAARNFAISDDGRAVGNVGVSNIEHRHGTGWASYWLSADSRGRGLASRALATAAVWAFDEEGLFRLELGHRVNNPASCAVARRAGFVAEGIERSKLRYGTERFDVETHSRLRTDEAPRLALLPH